jgi:hypothetical protein
VRRAENTLKCKDFLAEGQTNLGENQDRTEYAPRKVRRYSLLLGYLVGRLLSSLPPIDASKLSKAKQLYFNKPSN